MNSTTEQKLDAALERLCTRRQVLLREILRDITPDASGGRGVSPAITPEQYAVVSVLDAYGHGVTVKEIAEAIVTPHANVTRTCERLEKKGLIYRARGNEDRRQVIVRLTLAGTKLAGRVRRVTERLHERLWGVYTPDERRVLIGLLSKH